MASIAYNNGGKRCYFVPSNIEKKISKYYVGKDGVLYLCPECVLDLVKSEWHECCRMETTKSDEVSKKLGDFVRAWTRFTANYTDCTYDSIRLRPVNVHDTEYPVNSYYIDSDGETKLCLECQLSDEAPHSLHECQAHLKADNLDNIIEARERLCHTDLLERYIDSIDVKDTVFADDWSDSLRDITEEI